MAYNFPKIEINDYQRSWLEAVYNRFIQGKEISYQEIKIELTGKIPNNFNPRDINWHLCSGGRDIGLIGVWYINPDDQNLKLLDQMMYNTRKYLIENPNATSIPLKEISPNGENDDLKLCKLFNLIKHYTNQHFYVNKELFEENNIYIIKLSGEWGFDYFFEYEGLEKIAERFFKKTEIPPTEYNECENDNFKIIPNTAFILMAMDKNDNLLPDVHNTIKEVCSLFNIIAQRADDIEHAEKITDVILNKIRTSQYIIADLTSERPNVYYEVGFAHAIGKHPILYRRENTKIHFDLILHNVPEYKNCSELKEKLIHRFEAILGRKAISN
jgi:hypothetical protein